MENLWSEVFAVFIYIKKTVIRQIVGHFRLNHIEHRKKQVREIFHASAFCCQKKLEVSGIALAGGAHQVHEVGGHNVNAGGDLHNVTVFGVDDAGDKV